MKSIIKTGILFIFLPITVLASNNANIHFTFDSLFPSTPYKKVLTTCMQIRSSLPMLDEYKNSEEDYAILSDLMIGRMTYLQNSVDVMLANKALIHGDDIEYLSTILYYMRLELSTIFKSKPQEKELIIDKMLLDIKGKIELVLKAY